jgi:hypothetical protein
MNLLTLAVDDESDVEVCAATQQFSRYRERSGHSASCAYRIHEYVP